MAPPLPFDPYGYWIFPDGQVVPCAEAAHVESACTQLGLDADEELANDPEGENNFDIRMRAISEGAVRVIVERNGEEISFHYEKPAPAAAQSALRVAALFPSALVQLEYEGQPTTMARLKAELRDWASAASSDFGMGM